MQCPVDGSTLVITDRSGVEIDYCPTCRGVWLDRGELDKLIERNAAMGGAPRGAAPQQGSRDMRGGHKKKKLGGFLDELFDF